MQHSSFRKPQFWLGILVSITCLGAILLLVDPSAIVAALRTANYVYLLGAVALIIVYLSFARRSLAFYVAATRTVARVFFICKTSALC